MREGSLFRRRSGATRPRFVLPPLGLATCWSDGSKIRLADGARLDTGLGGGPAVVVFVEARRPHPHPGDLTRLPLEEASDRRSGHGDPGTPLGQLCREEGALTESLRGLKALRRGWLVESSYGPGSWRSWSYDDRDRLIAHVRRVRNLIEPLPASFFAWPPGSGWPKDRGKRPDGPQFERRIQSPDQAVVNLRFDSSVLLSPRLSPDCPLFVLVFAWLVVVG